MRIAALDIQVLASERGCRAAGRTSKRLGKDGCDVIIASLEAGAKGQLSLNHWTGRKKGAGRALRLARPAEPKKRVPSLFRGMQRQVNT